MDKRPRRRVRRDGYIDLFRPGHPTARRDGYVFEHRLVAYEAGILTDRSQQIHHLNRDRRDNRLANLEVLSLEEHRHLHLAEDDLIRNQFGVWARRPPSAPRSARPCVVCATTIPAASRPDQIYCQPLCRMRAFKAKQRAQRGAA